MIVGAFVLPPMMRGPKFDITEGVHCEGCHGPAEKWLEPHAEKGWTHEQSVKLGMYDTKNLLLRAEKCVSCHLAIEPDLVAAGHPDLLAFELDTFSGGIELGNNLCGASSSPALPASEWSPSCM